MSSAARPLVDWITIATFLIAIAAPAADTLVRTDEARGPAPEKRAPAPRPLAPNNLRTLTQYPAQYESFFDDTFGLRDVLVRGHAVVQLFGFGVAPAENVIVGEQGWLFYAGESTVEVYRGLAPLAGPVLEAWRRALEARRDFLRERGIEYLYVIAPNKESIYPEHMPGKFNVLGPTRLDQLAEHLRAHSDVEFLDLRAALLAKKRDDAPEDWLYGRLGTHWNGRGTYEAYRAIVERLAPRFGARAPFDRADLELIVVPGHGDTWGTRMYIDDLLPQRVTEYAPPRDPRWKSIDATQWGPGRVARFEMEDPALPRVLLFHDSFGPYLEKLLSRHFSSTVCVWSRSFDASAIELAEPDLVVELFVERSLVMPPPPLPVGVDDSARDAFERSSDVRWKLDRTSATAGLETDGATRVERGDACFSIRRGSAADRLFVPRFDTANTRLLVLCAEIDAEQPSTLTVLYLPPGETQYRHRNRSKALLRAGHNRVFLRFDPRRFDGRLCLQTEGVELCDLEIRAVE